MAKPVHRATIFLSARPEELWAALTEPEQTRKWFMGVAVESSFEPGAAIVFKASQQVPDGEEAPWTEAMRGEILACEPEKHLAFTMQFLDLDDPPSRMRWTLVTPGESCTEVLRVDLEHEFDEGQEGSDSYARATASDLALMLSALKTWLETSEPLAVDRVYS